MTLIETLKKSREIRVPVDRFEFTIRRPTDYEATQISQLKAIEILSKFVIGWNITELDIHSGGTSAPVEFDAELFAEWIQDHLELWQPLVDAIQGAYLKYAKKRDEALGKHETG